MAKGSVEGFEPSGDWVDMENPYTVGAIDSIIEAAGGMPPGEVEHRRLKGDGSASVTVTVPRREALSERLHDVARLFRVHREWETRPSPKKTADRFAKIEKAAVELLRALGDSEGGDIDHMPEALWLGGEQALKELGAADAVPHRALDPMLPEALAPQAALRRAARGVAFIRDWASRAERHNSDGATLSSNPHAGDVALGEAVKGLAGIWEELFERQVATSVSSETFSTPGGKAGGPFIRFLEAALIPLMGDETPGQGPLRERVRRLHLDRRPAHKSGSEKI